MKNQTEEMDNRLKRLEEEKSEAQEALAASRREAEERMDILTALCADYLSIYRVNLDTGNLKIYKITERLRGDVARDVRSAVDYDEAAEHYASKYVSPEDIAYVRAVTKREYVKNRLLEQENYFVRYHIRNDGSKLCNFEMHFARSEKWEKKPVAILAIRNVDSIVQKEESYRLETQRDIEETLYGARTGLWTIEMENGCAPRMYGDKTMRMLLGVEKGITPEECYNAWFDNIDPEYVDMVLEAVEELIKTGRSEVVYPWNHPKEGRLYIRCGGVPDRKYEDRGVRLKGYHQDITETMVTRKKQEKALMETLFEVKKANAAKTEFLSHMSHDIRTPINGILGMLAISEENPDDLEKLRECRAKIRTSAEHLLSLINDVLDISKLESGKFELTEEPFCLYDVLESSIGIVRPRAEEQRIAIEEDFADVVHGCLIGSPLHLRQILINIIGNAVKYNRPGGKIFIRADEAGSEENSPETGKSQPEKKKSTEREETSGSEKTTEQEKDKTYVFCRFIIRDTGIGMSEEFQQHLFEPFTQEGNKARTNYTGTGLGMAITHQLVRKMGGRITVESRLGEGSTFTVVLPIKSDLEFQDCRQEGYKGRFLASGARKDERCRIEKTPEKPKADLSGMRILLAEDNDLNREIALYFLETVGATVDNAENGQEAVNLFAASEVGGYDCILMDVMMPVMDGLETTRMIRGLARPDAKTVPIIAMTANAFAEDVQKAKEAGMNEHLAKPLDIERMCRVIAACGRQETPRDKEK